MTIKDFIETLEALDQDKEIEFEYDGCCRGDNIDIELETYNEKTIYLFSL